METLFDEGRNNTLPTYLVTGGETETLDLAITSFLAHTKDMVARKQIYPLKYQESYAIAQERLDSVRSGVHVLSDAIDYHLVGISMNWFLGLFNESVYAHKYQEIAKGLSISPEEFVDHAITTTRMRRQIFDAETWTNKPRTLSS